MGFWPFGGGKKQRSAESDEKQRDATWVKGEKDIVQAESKTTQPASIPTRKSSKSGQDESLKRLSRHRMSISTVTSHGHRQSRSVTSPATSTPFRESRRPFDEKDLYQHVPQSQSSLGRESFSVAGKPPTLHAKRTDYDPNIPRRKSSKRKAEDYAREQEIRAISSSPIPIPKRPSSFYGTGLLNKDTREIPGDLNRKLQRPSSHVSLPIPESLPSMDDLEHQHEFKVGALAKLSPRPTIKYDANPRKASGKQPERAKIPGVSAIPEEQLSDQMRINELADDLDAGGLRELMERDRRRRERKKDSDKVKLQRKLQRRAERQREEEAKKARTEEFVQNSAAARGQIERTTDTFGGKLKASDANKGTPSKDDPFRDPDTPERKQRSDIRNPFEDEQDDVLEGIIASDEEPEPKIPVRSPLRPAPTEKQRQRIKDSKQTLSPPTSPAARVNDGHSISQGSLLNREETTETVENRLERRASDQSSQRLSSWTSFFKKGNKRTLSSSFRGPGTPSEFSNTSRESFVRSKQQPPPIVPPTRSFRRADSATPQRTMSKFREDLPELPISPPDSRVQSPETYQPPAGGLVEAVAKKQAQSISESAPAESMVTPSSPVSGQASRLEQKMSMDLDNPSTNIPPEVSQSLASVDSEGSWLSGRPIKRFSGPQQIRKSQSSLRRQPEGAAEAEGEGLVDDEFLNRLSPTSRDRADSEETGQRRASSTVIDLQREGRSSPVPEVPPLPKQDDNGTETYRDGVGKQPTFIKQAGRAKSKEGLLQEFQTEDSKPADDESGTESPGDESGGEVQEVQLMRAQSVEYKGHARQVSAGSARLLDIRRSSQHMESSKDMPATAIDDTPNDATTKRE